jgi:hypothetical protein
MKNANKRKFSQDEDEKLYELVKTFGISNGITIKRYFNNRTTRQWKDRWRLYLAEKLFNRLLSHEIAYFENELILSGKISFKTH